MSLAIQDDTKYYGKYRGVVVSDDNPDNRKDDRLGTRYPGRILVTIDNLPSLGTRLAEPCFSQGSLHVPKVGDRVWVEFEEGNSTNAIWTGILYPTADGRPKPSSGDGSRAKPEQIWTRSGHAITIDDDEKSLTVAFDQNKIQIDGDGIVLQCGQTAITIKKDAIELKSGRGHVRIDAQGTRIEWLDLLKTHEHPTSLGPTAPSSGLAAIPNP